MSIWLQSHLETVSTYFIMVVEIFYDASTFFQLRFSGVVEVHKINNKEGSSPSKFIKSIILTLFID